MDELDVFLLEAWNRVSKKVRENRVLALKRSRRRFTGIGTRPMREWCLVIRASDTRINADPERYGAIIELDPEVIVPPEALDQGVTEWALRGGVPHTVLIDGRLIREMTRPVSIPWPGVTYEEAAAICGREYRHFKKWVHEAPFRIDRYREHGFPRLAHEEPEGTPIRGRRGGRPRVWTPSPIDPNNSTGRPPHPVWGTLWQSQWQKLPQDYQLIAQRVPVFKKGGRGRTRGTPEFRGWNWVCPGRLRTGHFTTEDTESTEARKRLDVEVAERDQSHPLWSALEAQRGEHIPCGRRCKYLYGPQTVWTLPMAMAAPPLAGFPGDGFDMPEDSGLAGQWFPGMTDTVAAHGTRVFACKRCWAVRSACMANETGWNEFVSTITGGLLYGHEVERPLDICPYVRKWPVYQRPPRKKSPEVASAAAGHHLEQAIARAT